MNILIISFSYLHRDPRIINQVSVLQRHGNVITMGYSPLESGSSKHIDLSIIINRPHYYYHYSVLLRKLLSMYYRFLRGLTVAWNWFFLPTGLRKNFDYWKFFRVRKLLNVKKNFQFDLIWANDIDALLLGVFLKQPNTKLIFDAHEYFVDEEGSEEWKKKHQTKRMTIFYQAKPFIDAMVTVNDSIASLFKTQFDVHPFVIRNVKKFQDMQVKLSEGENIRLVHHGAAFPFKGLEQYLRFFSMLPHKFELHFYLTPNDKTYYHRIQQMASSNPRIFFHQPIPVEQIISEISSYDIGCYFLEPTSINNLYSLPNKLFEFIQARLMIVTSPLPECQQIVDTYGCGITIDLQHVEKALAFFQALRKEDILQYKRKADQAARELNLENESIRFKEVLEHVFYKNSSSCVE